MRRLDPYFILIGTIALPVTFVVFIVLMVFILTSCSNVAQKLDTDVFYKRDMGIEVNGRQYVGVTSIPHAKRYEIILTPTGDLDLIVLRTCHREDSFEKEQSKIFFIPLGENRFKYTYEPVPDIEDSRVCPLRGDAFEADNGRHSWFFLDFENPKYRLQAKLVCNGETSQVNGVGVCQARQGLVQVLEFSEGVRFAPSEPKSCPEPQFKYGNRYEFKVGLEECLYHAQSRSGELLRITFIGYQGILVRSEV